MQSVHLFRQLSNRLISCGSRHEFFPNNPSSMGLLEKCGFIKEVNHKNAITKTGILPDEVIYGRFG